MMTVLFCLVCQIQIGMRRGLMWWSFCSAGLIYPSKWLQLVGSTYQVGFLVLMSITNCRWIDLLVLAWSLSRASNVLQNQLAKTVHHYWLKPGSVPFWKSLLFTCHVLWTQSLPSPNHPTGVPVPATFYGIVTPAITMDDCLHKNIS